MDELLNPNYTAKVSESINSPKIPEQIKLSHNKASDLIQSLLFGDLAFLELKLRQLSEEEEKNFFNIYQPFDLVRDYATIKFLSGYSSEKKIAPKINGLGLISALVLKDRELLTYWINLYNKVTNGLSTLNTQRLDKIKGMVEQALMMGEKEIAEDLIDFFSKQKINPTFSSKFWDLISRRGVRELSSALNSIQKLDIQLIIPFGQIKEYDEQVRQAWKDFLTSKLDM